MYLVGTTKGDRGAFAAGILDGQTIHSPVAYVIDSTAYSATASSTLQVLAGFTGLDPSTSWSLAILNNQTAYLTVQGVVVTTYPSSASNNGAVNVQQDPDPLYGILSNAVQNVGVGPAPPYTSSSQVSPTTSVYGPSQASTATSSVHGQNSTHSSSPTPTPTPKPTLTFPSVGPLTLTAPTALPDIPSVNAASLISPSSLAWMLLILATASL